MTYTADHADQHVCRHVCSRPSSLCCPLLQVQNPLLTTSPINWASQTEGESFSGGKCSSRLTNHLKFSSRWLEVVISPACRGGEKGKQRLELLKSHRLTQKTKNCRKNFVYKRISQRVIFIRNGFRPPYCGLPVKEGQQSSTNTLDKVPLKPRPSWTHILPPPDTHTPLWDHCIGASTHQRRGSVAMKGTFPPQYFSFASLQILQNHANASLTPKHERVSKMGEQEHAFNFPMPLTTETPPNGTKRSSVLFYIRRMPVKASFAHRHPVTGRTRITIQCQCPFQHIKFLMHSILLEMATVQEFWFNMI